MTTKLGASITFVLGLSLLGACAPAAQPGPAAPPPVAADNGQPRMQAAMQALGGAQSELTASSPNKGGHRERALEMIQHAMQEVQAGIQYASEHPHEVGGDEGPAAPLPVDEEVPGANTQPHMRAAVVQLREARKQLQDAAHDKGGHRKRAMELINEAIKQTRDGIIFADQHG
ncbi:MAG TPA: hypothetical protein VMJ10_28470 [Kofleriaceae bacterium]|nr:hypothetical protein [Kofleriaceae bacterium]